MTPPRPLRLRVLIRRVRDELIQGVAGIRIHLAEIEQPLGQVRNPQRHSAQVAHRNSLRYETARQQCVEWFNRARRYLSEEDEVKVKAGRIGGRVLMVWVGIR